MKHLTELELSSFSDGETLPADARAHIEACDQCLARLGDASIEADEIRVAVARGAHRVAASSPLPRAWLLLAATLGVVGALPMLRELDSFLLGAFHTGKVVRHVGPLVAKGFVATAGPLWAAFLIVSACTALLGSWMFKRWSKV